MISPRSPHIQLKTTLEKSLRQPIVANKDHQRRIDFNLQSDSLYRFVLTTFTDNETLLKSIRSSKIQLVLSLHIGF